MFLFPSPTGDLYFSITSANICSTKKEFPSPTGDLYFSIESTISMKNIAWFPSPTGDLYFSIIKVDCVISILFPFPSPTGDLYFSIIVDSVMTGDNDFGFRPLPGNYISQSRSMIQSVLCYWFPSPTGDLYFSILYCI